jgi:hypothetical protein
MLQRSSDQLNKIADALPKSLRPFYADAQEQDLWTTRLGAIIHSIDCSPAEVARNRRSRSRRFAARIEAEVARLEA